MGGSVNAEGQKVVSLGEGTALASSSGAVVGVKSLVAGANIHFEVDDDHVEIHADIPPPPQYIEASPNPEVVALKEQVDTVEKHAGVALITVDRLNSHPVLTSDLVKSLCNLDGQEGQLVLEGSTVVVKQQVDVSGALTGLQDTVCKLEQRLAKGDEKFTSIRVALANQTEQSERLTDMVAIQRIVMCAEFLAVVGLAIYTFMR